MRDRVLLLIAVFGASNGCDVGMPYIDLSKRSPTPVDAEVDKLLTEWQRQRAGKKFLYATFKRTTRDLAFKEVRVANGSMRYRHSDRGRLDVNTDEQGRGRELILWTKENELWHLSADDHRATIYTFDEKFLANFMSGSWFVWLIPADKTTVQKHGRITKLKEDRSTVVLSVENTRYAKEPVYQSMTVHLKKPSMSPAKIIVKENPDTEVTYEFTAVHDDVELSESDFTPPRLDSSWKVTRPKFENDRLIAKQPTNGDREPPAKTPPAVKK